MGLNCEVQLDVYFPTVISNIYKSIFDLRLEICKCDEEPTVFVFYAILYKRLEHPQILVPVTGPGTNAQSR